MNHFLEIQCACERECTVNCECMYINVVLGSVMKWIFPDKMHRRSTAKISIRPTRAGLRSCASIFCCYLYILSSAYDSFIYDVMCM
jgi:hypothetical protein